MRVCPSRGKRPEGRRDGRDAQFAKHYEDAEDEIASLGQGFVDMFDLDGKLLGHVAIHGRLNAPWGITRAPTTGFGKFSGDVLVGNFGDGRIMAFKAFSDCSFGVSGFPHMSNRPCFLDEGPLRPEEPCGAHSFPPR